MVREKTKQPTKKPIFTPLIKVPVSRIKQLKKQPNNYFKTTEAPTEHINELIVTSEMTPDIGPNI